ncbi:MAG: hypothetical protein CMJ58_27540 [Planctomycetaceae bacterium]|nr:hypothetical protein [Planctomycetaceae bacterium]
MNALDPAVEVVFRHSSSTRQEAGLWSALGRCRFQPANASADGIKRTHILRAPGGVVGLD